MTFEEILDQAVAMLKGCGQVTYRTLKRQFDLDNEALEDLKDQLLFSHPVVDADGRGLIWAGKTEGKRSRPGRHRRFMREPAEMRPQDAYLELM
jgi:hypothetical protein